MSNSIPFDDIVPTKLRELGLSDQFLEQLSQRDDDWSFIIKCHAILEATASQALTSYFGDPNLKEVFRQLEMGNKRYGKAQILMATGRIDRFMLTFLFSFGELRNELVHRIENTGFSLDSPASDIELEKKRKALLKAGVKLCVSSGPPTVDEPSISELFRLVPRVMLFSTMQWCVAVFYLAEKAGQLRGAGLNMLQTVLEEKSSG